MIEQNPLQPFPNVTWSRPVAVPLDRNAINLTTTTINNTQNSRICWAQQQITVETPGCSSAILRHAPTGTATLGNVLLPHPRGAPLEDEVEAIPFELRDIQSQSRLGGLLKHYYRNAA